MNNSQKSNTIDYAPLWLRQLGVKGWLFLGVVLALAVLVAFLSVLTEIVVPLLISILAAILLRPLVEFLTHRKVPRTISSIIAMLLVLIGLGALVYLVIVGVVQQTPEIASQMQAGVESLQIELGQPDISPSSPEQVEEALSESLPILFKGVFSFLGSTISNIVSLGVGTYFSLFFLYFFLRDTNTFESWIATQITLSAQVSEEIVTDASQTVLVYFRGTALTASITAAVVAIPLIVLNVPLAGSILVVYFFTSFVPYLGAWVGGAFAVLIALGAGGAETALIVLIAVIISNGILQTVVSSWALGSMLKLHPFLIFLVTITAGIIGGVLLMVLAVPLTAITVQIIQRLREEGVVMKTPSEVEVKEKL